MATKGRNPTRFHGSIIGPFGFCLTTSVNSKRHQRRRWQQWQIVEIIKDCFQSLPFKWMQNLKWKCSQKYQGSPGFVVKSKDICELHAVLMLNCKSGCTGSKHDLDLPKAFVNPSKPADERALSLWWTMRAVKSGLSSGFIVNISHRSRNSLSWHHQSAKIPAVVICPH